MVFVRDEGSVFDVPLDEVWTFVSSGDHHSGAHLHRAATRERLSERSGRYSWEQSFDGRTTRFTMVWTSFHPVGVAYDVVEGPFAGSRFFLYYLPMGARTGVGVLGEFVSPTLSEAEIPAAVDRFFTTEFEQDHAAMRRDHDAAVRGA
jgi:hypothetical protein